MVKKFLSRGFVPDVPVVTANLTVRMGLTITSLLHEVDLVLGINWLQLVSPVIDWSSGKVYLPNAVHTALLQGDWLERSHESRDCDSVGGRGAVEENERDRGTRQDCNFKVSQILESCRKE